MIFLIRHFPTRARVFTEELIGLPDVEIHAISAAPINLPFRAKPINSFEKRRGSDENLCKDKFRTFQQNAMHCDLNYPELNAHESKGRNIIQVPTSAYSLNIEK